MLSGFKALISLSVVFFILMGSFMPLSAADTYTYDSLNRIIQAVYENGATEDYTYDSNGNILQAANTAPNIRVSGAGYNSPYQKFRASLALNVIASAPESGKCKYYYTRQRLSFASAEIINLTIAGNIVTVYGIGDAAKVNGADCMGCDFIATIIDDDTNGDEMGIKIFNPEGSYYFQDPPGDSGIARPLDGGNFSIVAE